MWNGSACLAHRIRDFTGTYAEGIGRYPSPMRVVSRVSRTTAALVAVAMVGVVHSPAFAQGNGAWDLRAPAEYSADGTSLDITMQAGTRVSTTVEAVNFTSDPLPLTIVPSSGRDDLPVQRRDSAGGRIPSPDVASWIRVESPSVTLAPRATARIPFSVTVPASTPAGDYLASIYSTAPDEADQTTGRKTPRGWQSLIRLRVPGAEARELLVGGVDVRSDRVVVAIENTGNMRIRPEVTVEAVGADGVAIESIAPYRPSDLESGERSSPTINLEGAAAGVTVTVSSEAGVEQRTWPLQRLDVTVVPEGAVPATVGSDYPDAATSGAIAFAVLLVLIGLVAGRRTKSPKTAARSFDPEPASVALSDFLPPEVPPASRSRVVVRSGTRSIISGP